MSYGIMPYRCEIGLIEETFGVENAETVDRILDSATRSLQELDYTLDPQIKSFEILKGYLNGIVEYPHMGYHYWYAIEILVRGFGEIMNNQYWYPADIDVLWKIDALRLYNLGIKTLPRPNDFPVVFIGRQKDFPILSNSTSKAIENKDMKNQFLSWISEAEANKQDIFLFYY